MKQADFPRWMPPALLVLWAAGAFWDGLYSPGQQLVAVALTAAAALGLRRAVRLSRAETAALLLLLLGAALSLRSPASAGTAAHGPVVVAGWALALLLGRGCEGGEEAERRLARFWAVLGVLMAFGGLVLISCIPVHHSGRLASFLGYPIAVGVLGLLGLAGALPDLAAGRRWAGMLALGNGMAILLSGSRGVWLAALPLIAYLAWAAPGMLRRAWPRTLPALALALAASLWAAPAVADRSWQPLAIILLIALWTLVLLETFHQHRLVRIAGLLAVAAALVTAPGWPWLLGRATALPLTEGSSVERLTFLRDGLRLLAEHPLGAGYRGWTALHLQAASYGYYSAEVHSAPLDLAIAFGWAAGAAFLFLLVRFLAQLRHGRRWGESRQAALAGLAALGLHALIDWDLSYALFSFPLWFGFGLAAPDAARGIRWPAGLTATAAGLALAGAVWLGAGDVLTDRAAESLRLGEPEMALRHAGAAVAVSPWNDVAHAYRAEALAATGRAAEAAAAWERAQRLGPREPWYAQRLAELLAVEGRPREAAAAWREYVSLWPWQAEVYERALQAHLDLIRQARLRGDEALARELTESGRQVLAALDAQKEKEPPGIPRRPMPVDSAIIREARAQLGGVP